MILSIPHLYNAKDKAFFFFSWEQFKQKISLIKNTPITERVNFQLKAEFLNAFNRHIFATPDTNPYDNGFGVPTGLINGPRIVQITGRVTF